MGTLYRITASYRPGAGWTYYIERQPAPPGLAILHTGSGYDTRQEALEAGREDAKQRGYEIAEEAIK